MLHNYSLAGSAFRLRPVKNCDAEFIRDLRCNPNLNYYLHATSSRVADQLAWLSNYYLRPDDYYFVVEHLDNGELEGLISLYEIDLNKPSHGEWGRWILRSGSLGSVESAFLIYKFGFEILGLDSMYCRTVSTNEKVVSFHDSCGIPQKKILNNYFQFAPNNMVDAVEHRINRNVWLEIAPRLQRLTDLTAMRLKRIRAS